MTSGLTFDPREIDAFVAKLEPRRELAYRLAIRGLCDGCCDRKFKQRTDELMHSGGGAPEIGTMSRDGMTTFSDIAGKLELLRVQCEKCGRKGNTASCGS
jgi:hypothetical protein